MAEALIWNVSRVRYHRNFERLINEMRYALSTQSLIAGSSERMTCKSTVLSLCTHSMHVLLT